MTYTDAVVKEVMRLHPIVGGVFRRALCDFDLGGFHIPKVMARDFSQIPGKLTDANTACSVVETFTKQPSGSPLPRRAGLSNSAAHVVHDAQPCTGLLLAEGRAPHQCVVSLLQGRKIFLSVGHVMKHDERWADQPPPLSPDCFNPDRCVWRLCPDP